MIVGGGKEYGTGSSRDWAAKGTVMLGINVVIVESFERIHRSNLVGTGVLPLEFQGGATRESLKLNGSELFDITGIEADTTPGMDLDCRITRAGGSTEDIKVTCRIDMLDEVEYYRHGGILQYVLRELADRSDILALEFHVDYWDYIGWKDKFAKRAFTNHQQGYVFSLKGRYKYTPQMVVGGVSHAVGSKRGVIEAEIKRRKQSMGANPKINVRKENG